MTKGTCSETARGCLTCLLNLRHRMPAICSFEASFRLSHFFGHFQLLLELKTKIIQVLPKILLNKSNFCVQMHYFAAAQQTSTGKLSAFSQKFKKTVCPLEVNQTKVTSINTFIGNIFTLQTEKTSKNDKRTVFLDCSRILDCCFNTQTLNATYMSLCEVFQFQQFFGHFQFLLELKTKFIKQ